MTTLKDIFERARRPQPRLRELIGAVRQQQPYVNLDDAFHTIADALDEIAEILENPVVIQHGGIRGQTDER